MINLIARLGLWLLLTVFAMAVSAQEGLAIAIIDPYNAGYVYNDTLTTGSGNGTLDWNLFTGSPKITNAAGTFNGDNANNGLLTTGWNESFATSGADLKAFYTLNFGITQPGQIAITLFLDLNETAGGKTINTLNNLTVISNPTTINGLTSPSLAYTGDITSAQQNAITDGVNTPYTGGTTLATIAQPFSNLPVLENRADGLADYAILTNIDPFTLANNDILLFNIQMSNLDNGSETWFLSGTYGNMDFPPDFFTPEPTTGLLVGIGMAGLAWQRRRQRKSPYLS